MEAEKISKDGPATTQRHRAVRALRWVGSARLLSQVVTWGLTALTVRLLQPRDYGLVAISGLFTIFASMVMDGGLGPMLVSRRDLSQSIQGAAAVGVLLLSSIFAATIILAAPTAGSFFKNNALVSVLRVSSLQLPLSALAVVPFSLLLKEMNFRRIAVIQTSASIAQGLATLALAYWGAAYWALIYGTLVGATIRAASLWLALSERPTPNFRLWELRPILRSSTHMVGQRLLYFVNADFDTFLLSRMAGAVDLGPYSLARTLSHTALDQIAGTVNQVTLPSFAAKAGDQGAQLHALKVMLALSAALAFPLFWLLGIISPTAFLLVFGPRWSALVLPFTAFTLMLPLRTVYTLVDTAVVGSGGASTTFKNMIAWTSIMIPILLLGAMFGARGEAIAWAIGFPLVFMNAMHRISRHFGVSLRDILQPLVAPAACAASASAAVKIVAFFLGLILPLLALLTIEVVLAISLYWLLMARYGRNHYDQVTKLVLQLLGR